MIIVYLGFNQPQVASLPVKPKSSDLIINELMASNGKGLQDEDGDYSDWVEIYNQSDHAVNLAGWALSDDPNQLAKWPFPEISLGRGEYLVVFASGKDRRPGEGGGELHTNFKLSKAGEFVALYHMVDDEVKDALGARFPAQLRYLAYGRYGPEGNFGYSARPTPGATNEAEEVWEGIAEPVSFSVARGFYEQPFWVELGTATPGTTIRYTTDGSRPGEGHGEEYTGPIMITTTTVLRATAIKPNYIPAEVMTHSYIFVEDVLAQAGMDPRLGADMDYASQVKEGLLAIPSISLVTDDENYYIYAHAWQRGREWERPVSVELVYPSPSQGGTEGGADRGFQVNAGFRTHGRGGRSLDKISFRLFFRGIYGPTRLAYQLFPDSPVKTFETLVLRGGGNRNYTNFRMTRPFLKDTTYTRDEWLRASQIAMSGVGSHGIFVHLYLNGLYWGLYNLVERPDAAFMASYYGGAEEDWYVRIPEGTINGSKERYETLTGMVEAGGLEDPEKYAQLQQYVDTAHFSDYMILHWYVGAQDWPHNNWYLGLENSAGQIRHLAWDGEETWLPPLDPSLERGGGGAEIRLADGENFISQLFMALMQNPNFRLEFADRLYKHLFNHGALADANAQARWLSLNRSIEAAIRGEMARWGILRSEPAVPEGWLKEPDNFLGQILQATDRWAHSRVEDELVTPPDWLAAQDDVLRQMAGNADKLIALARQAGYYPQIDPPAFNQHGGQVPEGFTLTLTAASGVIYYTVDGTDPRAQITGAVAPQALVYQAPLILTTTTQVKARALQDETWSALNEATFFMRQPGPGNLKITEIMYNPPGGDDYEFIELKNSGETILDLSNLTFEGIDFAFPLGTTLAPGEFIALVRNPDAFVARYPGVTIGGTYTKRLSNRGETIRIKDGLGNIVVSVTYDDENGWPLSPDGHGDSLILINPAGDPNDPQNWGASAKVYGRPGADD